jgi:hypothetical protein
MLKHELQQLLAPGTRNFDIVVALKCKAMKRATGKSPELADKNVCAT